MVHRVWDLQLQMILTDVVYRMMHVKKFIEKMGHRFMSVTYFRAERKEGLFEISFTMARP